MPAQRVPEQLGPARLRPVGHLLGVREVVGASLLDDGVVLHLIAEGDGGEIALEDVRDLGIVPILPIRERNAQLEAGLRGDLLQGILVKVHDLGLGRVRGHGFLIGFLRGDGGRFVLAAGGSGGRRQDGQQDKGPYPFHSHHSFPTLQN